MKGYIEERVINAAKYIVENKTTVRATALHLGVSKSTIHKDITERLEKINKSLYNKVRRLLNKNKNEKHLRGGLATKNKYTN